MKYYELYVPEDERTHYIESKSPLSDHKVKLEAVDQGLIDFFEAQTVMVTEITEDQYEESV